MTTFPGPQGIPDWLRTHLKTLGFDGHPEQLSSRRGVSTYVSANCASKMLVKLAETTSDGSPANESGILRESAVLSAIEALRQRFRPTLLRNGKDVALLENWIDGTPAFRDASSLAANGNEPALLNLLGDTLKALNVLHGCRWAHGDLQPLHFLLTDDGAVLLDYGVAQSDEMPLGQYRGGMVHFNAPEVAEAIIATGCARATPTSDIFSLGATFAFSLASKVVGEYDMTDSWEDKLRMLARGRLRTELLRDLLGDVPIFLKLLLRLLEVDPSDRPDNAAAALNLLSHD